eukprot:1923377-Rhodomonas_salina.1
MQTPHAMSVPSIACRGRQQIAAGHTVRPPSSPAPPPPVASPSPSLRAARSPSRSQPTPTPPSLTAWLRPAGLPARAPTMSLQANASGRQSQH